MYRNLQELMDKEGITYTQIAKILNCQYQTVKDIVNGKINKGFSYEDACKIKNALFPNFDLEYIFVHEQRNT